MRRGFTVAVSAVALVAAAAGAQGTTTSCSIINADACQKAQDMSFYLVPQLSLGLAGGNPVLGSSGVIGKLGHFSLGVRVTALKGTIFDSVHVSTTGATQSGIATKEQWIPVPSFDGVVGIFGGIPVGVTHIGSLDALVSLVYVPDVSEASNDNDEVGIEFKSHTKFGFGARVGLIDEEAIIPSITVSYLRRGLPKVSFQSQSNDNIDFGVENLEVDVATWRVMATKTFLAFALSAGFGGDTYDADGLINAGSSVLGAGNETASLTQSVTRSNWFVDLTLNLGPVKLAGEFGGVSGGKIPTYNTFDPKADASRTYASLGLRLGW